MKMTIKEISKRLGVSTATVSLALNNKPGVGEETRRLVWEMVRQSGYKKVNHMNKNILFIKYIDNGEAVEYNGDFIASIIDMTEGASSELGYNLTVKNIQSNLFATEISLIDYSLYAGAILLATEFRAEHGEILKDIPIPIVAVDNYLDRLDIDSVVMDNYGGIYKAVECLYNLSHTQIGYIDSTVRFSNFDKRTIGYRLAMNAFGLKVNPKFIKKIHPTSEQAYYDMIKLLESKEPLPTAFVAGNDGLAIGAIKAFKTFGIKIPEEISIIGFDDIPFSKMLDKSLSTIAVNKQLIAQTAVKTLDAKIKNDQESGLKITITNKLINRETTMLYTT